MMVHPDHTGCQVMDKHFGHSPRHMDGPRLLMMQGPLINIATGA